MNQRLLTIEQAAQYLGCCEGTVRRYIQENRLPAIKVGSMRRVDRKVLDEWIERQLRDALPA